MTTHSLSRAIILALTAILFCCRPQAPGSKTVVTIKGDQWLINGDPILKGSPAEGLLMNTRMVNAVFEDTGPRAKDNLPEGFDPGENTRRFIAQIPGYYTHGVRGFTLSLQGGMPGYEGAVNTAFNADGSLRKEYLDRVEGVIRAADEQGAVVILSCFYQRQHSHERALDGKQAVLNAVENVVRWIADQKFSNVVLEVSNEYAHGGYNRWKDSEWLKSVEGQVELIRHAKAIAPKLLVSTSGMGSGVVPEPVAQAADFILLHLNTTPISLYPERITEARKYGKPVLCNEDDKIGKVGAEAARVSVKSGAGWGFMHSKKNQAVPFEFDGAGDDTLVYAMLEDLTTAGRSLDDIPETLLSVLITDPIDGDVFPSGDPVTFRAVITGIPDSTGVEVRFFAANKMIGKCTAAPWEFTWKDAPAGKYDVVAVVQDTDGRKLLRSRPVDFEVRPEGSLR